MRYRSLWHNIHTTLRKFLIRIGLANPPVENEGQQKRLTPEQRAARRTIQQYLQRSHPHQPR